MRSLRHTNPGLPRVPYYAFSDYEGSKVDEMIGSLREGGSSGEGPRDPSGALGNLREP